MVYATSHNTSYGPEAYPAGGESGSLGSGERELIYRALVEMRGEIAELKKNAWRISVQAISIGIGCTPAIGLSRSPAIGSIPGSAP